MSILKPREQRRSVALGARIRADDAWHDAHVHNISSRGMMLGSARDFPRGAVIEIRRGQSVVIARVMWSRGARCGVLSQDRIRIDEFIEARNAVPRIGGEGQLVERRATPRAPVAVAHDESRQRSAAIQFASVAGGAIVGGGLIMIAVSQMLGSVAGAVAGALS